MLDSRGLRLPPYGVPTFFGRQTPFIITPLTRYFLISDTTLPSLIVLLIIPISLS